MMPLRRGYKILNSPLTLIFSAAAEHFDETDAPIDESERPASQEPKQQTIDR